MDQLRERLDALEQHVQLLTRHTHLVQRRLRWWPGLACGLAVARLLGWGLPLSLAREDARDKDKDQKGLAQRVAALEQLLKHFSREKNEIFITGANLHIVNGLGGTDCLDEQGEGIPDCPNGLGNPIVGYNEPREEEFFGKNIRTGSYNVVVGAAHNFSRFGGVVVGGLNTISGDFAAVTGGSLNTASGVYSSVCGGISNVASGEAATVCGGQANGASDFAASGPSPTVSGGLSRTAEGGFGWVAGSLVEGE
jgi:hypothetical protein